MSKEHDKNEGVPYDNFYVEIPSSDEDEEDQGIGSSSRKESVREKFGANDPDFEVLWGMSVKELQEICDDEDHPLHEKANRFLNIITEPLRETMKNVVLPIFESMPKPDLSGITKMIQGISENFKPTADVSAINNILTGIDIPKIDTSFYLPKIETLEPLAGFDIGSLYSGIDFGAITSAVDTSAWLSSISASLPKYEISPELRKSLEVVGRSNDDQEPDLITIESDDGQNDETTQEDTEPRVLSQEVNFSTPPQELRAPDLVKVVTERVDGVNGTLHHYFPQLLQVMMQSVANTAEANAKIEEANKLSDQANRIIEEAGKSSDSINARMLNWSRRSGKFALLAMILSGLALIHTMFNPN